MSTEYSQLKDMTEKRLGVTLCDHSFQEALVAGKRKYDWIVSRYGETDSMYKEEWYFLEIIYECLKSLMFSEYYRLRSGEIEKKKRPACQQVRLIN